MNQQAPLSYTAPVCNPIAMKDKLIERAKLAQSRGKVGEAMRLYMLAAEWPTVRDGPAVNVRFPHN